MVFHTAFADPYSTMLNARSHGHGDDAAHRLRTVSSMYPNEATRREDILRDWGIKDLCGKKILPAKLSDTGDLLPLVRLVTRHPVYNDRHYDALVREYSNWLDRSGYDDNDAGAISVVASDSRRDTWLAIGGATRCDAVCSTALEKPDSAHLKAFVRSGGFTALHYSENTPDFIIYYMMDTLNNKNTLGATHTIMQRICNIMRLTEAHATYVQDCEAAGDEPQDQ